MARFRYKHGDRPLDGFTIEHGLGRGGFGEVYYAVSDSGRQVAIKSVQNYEEIELRGIAQCMNLKSPYLVTIFDVKHNDDHEPFVIMEYVAGPSLRDMLDAEPNGLGPDKAAFFLREIAKGLQYLHDCGVVHRDLKPHNVFYEDGIVKIGDYSLSKSITTSHRSGHTMTVGTVHYMAPEISVGRYDHTVDIYALGVMLFEMLTGRPPHEGQSMAEVLMRHLSGEVDVSNIPEPFASTIMRAMAKAPEDRFQSAQEMAEAIFGEAEIQKSVAALAPEGLSVVARNLAPQDRAKNHAAAKGAAARDAGRANQPPPRSHKALHARQPALAGVGVGAGVGSGDDAFPYAAAAFTGGTAIAESKRAKFIKFASSVGMHAPLPLAKPNDAVDPIAEKSRLKMALGAGCVVALVASKLDGAGLTLGNQSEGFVAHLLMSAVPFLAIAKTGRRCPKVRHASGLRQRFLLSVAGIAGLVGMGFLVRNTFGRSEDAIETAMGLSVVMLLIDWRAAVSPLRRNRIVLLPVLAVTVAGMVLAASMDGRAIAGGGIMAAIALMLQIASPFDPKNSVTSNNWATGLSENLKQRAASQHKYDVDLPLAMASVATSPAMSDSTVMSKRSRLVAIILAAIFPFPGLHRFYVGKWKTGLLWLFTGGIAGIGQIIDLVMISVGVFRDTEDQPLVAWRWNDQEPTGENLPVNEYSSIPRFGQRLWRPTGFSLLLSIIASGLIFGSIMLGVVAPLGATLIASGLPDPSVTANIAHDVGLENWDELVWRITIPAGILMALFAVAILVWSRTDAGARHVVRAIVGCGGLALCSGLFVDLVNDAARRHVTQYAMKEEYGRLLLELLDPGYVMPVLLLASGSLASLLVIGWPARKVSRPMAADQGAV